MRVGLVLIAAASTGPIGSVLTRMVRGDLPLAVSLVTAFGGLNLLTVPVLGALLLQRTVPFPLVPVLTSLLLVFAPLLLGYLWTQLSQRRNVSAARTAVQMRFAGAASSILLATAVSVALVSDFERVAVLLFGPVGLLSLVTMMVIAAAAFFLGTTSSQRATLAIVLNARGGGLALTVAALHFADVQDARATVVTFSLVTQVLPTVVTLVMRRVNKRPSVGHVAG